MSIPSESEKGRFIANLAIVSTIPKHAPERAAIRAAFGAGTITEREGLAMGSQLGTAPLAVAALIPGAGGDAGQDAPGQQPAAGSGPAADKRAGAEVSEQFDRVLASLRGQSSQADVEAEATAAKILANYRAETGRPPRTA